MPYINIRVTGKPVTKDQKNALIKDSTDMIERVLGKPPEITWVVIDEVPADSWGAGGAPATQFLK